MVLFDDKIKIREIMSKLPNKVQAYIQEEHEKKVECDDMVGIANRVIEHNMWNVILMEDEKSVIYWKIYHSIEDKRLSVRKLRIELEIQDNRTRPNKKKLRSINANIKRLNERIERDEKKLAYIESKQTKRHDARIKTIADKIARRSATNDYKRLQDVERRKSERIANRDKILKESVAKEYLVMDENYAIFAQYDYMMKDGKHYIVMNRERKDNPANNVNDSVKPLTMKAAELIVNLSEFRSEMYNWIRWPNVYDARDIHLVGLNSYMLGHTEDVNTSVFTLNEYEKNKNLDAQIHSIDVGIAKLCEKMEIKVPNRNTIEKYPEKIQIMFEERNKLDMQKADDYVTRVIVSPELVSVARMLTIKN